MKPEQLKKFGIIGALLLAVLALFFVYSRYNKSKKRSEIPPDDLPAA